MVAAIQIPEWQAHKNRNITRVLLRIRPFVAGSQRPLTSYQTLCNKTWARIRSVSMIEHDKYNAFTVVVQHMPNV